MGLTGEQKSQILQSYAEYRTRCQQIISHPSEFPSPADATNPELPWNIYEHRLQQILGQELAAAFETEYRLQHQTLVKSRRAEHRSAVMSAAVEHAGKQ
jgi:hypothetical protein